MNNFARSRHAFWGDIRFLIGLALVALSIGGVWAVLSSSGTTTPVLQAGRTVVAGEPLVSGDFRTVEVNLGTLSGEYLAPEDLRPGLTAARTLADGELVPRSAAEPADARRSTIVVIESSTGIPSDVTTGSVVELWHAPAAMDGAPAQPPRILVAEAIVATVTTTEGMLAGDGTAVEVVIDRVDVAEVLAAITGGSVLSVVPIGAGS